jgi:hypothetical protein
MTRIFAGDSWEVKGTSDVNLDSIFSVSSQRNSETFPQIYFVLDQTFTVCRTKGL